MPSAAGHRLAALVIALTLVAPLPAAADRACTVSGVEGAPARVLTGGSWSTLGPGPLPPTAQAIATGPGARVELACDSGLVVTVGAGTEVALDRLLGAGPSEGVVLRLLRGILGVDAPTRDWQSFEVRTPLAIASARTTAWLVEHTEPTGTAAFVRDGSVAITAARGGAAIVLSAGEGVTILPGAERVPVIRWGEARRAGAGATLGFGWR